MIVYGKYEITDEKEQFVERIRNMSAILASVCTLTIYSYFLQQQTKTGNGDARWPLL